VSPAPILVFAWGNPSRADDGLGPLFAEWVAALHLDGVECLVDFQLQVEHVLDLAGRSKILFVDAATSAALPKEAPYILQPLTPRADASISTHAMSPEALLHTYLQAVDTQLAPAWMLGIRGENWNLGEAMSQSAQNNLMAAIEAFQGWLIQH